MNKKTEFRLSMALSVLLLVCLIPMPYGYYTFVRFVAMCVFAWMAYEGYQRRENNEWMVFLALAVLFQPLLLIKLGRVLWMIVDVVVAAYLIYRQIKGNKSEMDNSLRRFKSFVPVVFMCAALCGCVDVNHQSEFYRIQRNDIAGYEAFINKYPQSIYVKDARERIETAREEIRRKGEQERREAEMRRLELAYGNNSLSNGSQPYASWYGRNLFFDDYTPHSEIRVKAPSNSDVVVIVRYNNMNGRVAGHRYDGSPSYLDNNILEYELTLQTLG